MMHQINKFQCFSTKTSTNSTKTHLKTCCTLDNYCKRPKRKTSSPCNTHPESFFLMHHISKFKKNLTTFSTNFQNNSKPIVLQPAIVNTKLCLKWVDLMTSIWFSLFLVLRVLNIKLTRFNFSTKLNFKIMSWDPLCFI